ncbi:hypothetical protein C8Q77DRAFT_1074852 [Trametes polyzona]|nr:hypothetical protein C8Q77DRAFT_1074851 [Trametes polyzona]KAI0630944.1 hypothetical protein C8Q77DRAFT_1074852 [Trametes polyzona]
MYWGGRSQIDSECTPQFWHGLCLFVNDRLLHLVTAVESDPAKESQTSLTQKTQSQLATVAPKTKQSHQLLRDAQGRFLSRTTTQPMFEDEVDDTILGAEGTDMDFWIPLSLVPSGSVSLASSLLKAHFKQTLKNRKMSAQPSRVLTSTTNSPSNHHCRYTARYPNQPW